jgi:hypothetical protein
VLPPVCQQIEPADTPLSTTPDCQTSCRIASSPCTRHTATRFATLPPSTQMTSWPNRWPRMSSTLGIGKSCRCDMRNSDRANAA